MGESMDTSSTKLLLDYLPWLKLRKHGTRCLSIIWKKVAAPPVIDTTFVSGHGQLVAIGGVGSDKKSTTAVYVYNPTTDSWEVISHMWAPRHRCIAALLPNKLNQLMVVEGIINTFRPFKSVEFASVE